MNRPMFAHHTKPRWICNARADSSVVTDPPGWVEVGPPCSVHEAWPEERLKDDGLVGLYQVKKISETVENAVERITEDAASFDDLDLFGEGKSC